MDEQIQKDVEFALLVNQQLIDAPGTFEHVITSNEAYRQFITETQMIRSITPEQWFERPASQGWAAVIRANRLAYEKKLAEAESAPVAENDVVAELQKLRDEVEALRASQQTADPTPEAEPDPNAEPEPETDEEPDAEGDEAA